MVGVSTVVTLVSTFSIWVDRKIRQITQDKNTCKIQSFLYTHPAATTVYVPAFHPRLLHLQKITSRYSLEGTRLTWGKLLAEPNRNSKQIEQQEKKEIKKLARQSQKNLQRELFSLLSSKEKDEKRIQEMEQILRPASKEEIAAAKAYRKLQEEIQSEGKISPAHTKEKEELLLRFAAKIEKLEGEKLLENQIQEIQEKHYLDLLRQLGYIPRADTFKRQILPQLFEGAENLRREYILCQKQGVEINQEEYSKKVQEGIALLDETAKKHGISDAEIQSLKIDLEERMNFTSPVEICEEELEAAE